MEARKGAQMATDLRGALGMFDEGWMKEGLESKLRIESDEGKSQEVVAVEVSRQVYLDKHHQTQVAGVEEV